MYRAINKYVIIKRDYTEEEVHSSGLILEKNTLAQVLDFEVVATTEQTEELQGKTIMAERSRVKQMNEGQVVYGAISYDDILAVKED